VHRFGIEDVGSMFPHSVTYHPSCHSLRMLHVGDAPVRLLRQVRGLELIELLNQEQCCGFGGTFAIKNADVSVAMLSEKSGEVLKTGGRLVSKLPFPARRPHEPPLTAREEILARIRAALPDLKVPVEASNVSIARSYSRLSNIDRSACLQLFIDRLLDYDTEVIELTDETELSAAASKWLSCAAT
jgi:hypothetical protein